MSSSLVSQLSMIILQPQAFFRSLTKPQNNRRWLWMALIILVLISLSSIQQMAASPTSSDETTTFDNGGFEGGTPFDPGFIPDDGTSTESQQADPSTVWVAGLKIIGGQILIWLVLSVLLCEVPMFKGYAPDFSKNVQIAIWVTVPFAVLSLVQLAYISAGGTIGVLGFSGFLDKWEAYASLELTMQSIIHAIASQLTLFWLWHLALLYIAARQTLQGKRTLAILVVTVWIILQVSVNSFSYYQEQIQSVTLDDAQIIEMPQDGMYPMDEMGEMDGMSDETNRPDEEIKPEGEPVDYDRPGKG